MSTTMAAQEIGEAWLAYVTETFMLQDGYVRPEVQEQYLRLENSGTITQERELWRTYTDELVENILLSSPEERCQLLSTIDPKSLSYVQDRIQCGTDLLTALVQKGLQIDMGGAEALPDFFRQILLQKQA